VLARLRAGSIQHHENEVSHVCGRDCAPLRRTTHSAPFRRRTRKIQRYFKSGEGEYGEHDAFLGVRTGQVFALSKEFIEMPPAEIEKLLESPLHEVRADALSIMDKQVRTKKTDADRRRALFDLYTRRVDRINNWDLVDLAAPFVLGGYLFDKPRKTLYKLTRSKNIWERRTAIVSTAYFIRQGDLADTFKIAELLVHHRHDLMHKGHRRLAAGSRQAGSSRPASIPRSARRDDAAHDAIEHFDKDLRTHYLGLNKAV